LYQQLLGRDGADEYVMQWVNSGMTIAEIEEQIKLSEEYLGNQVTTPGTTPTGTTPTGTTPPTQVTTPGTTPPTPDFTSPTYTTPTEEIAPTYTDEEIALYKYRTMTPQAFAASGYALPTVGGVSVGNIGDPSYPTGQSYQGPTYSGTAATPNFNSGSPVLDGAINPDYAAGNSGDTVGGVGNASGMGYDIEWGAPSTQTMQAGEVFSTPAGDYQAVDNGYGQLGLAPIDDASASGGEIIYNLAQGEHHVGIDPNTGQAWYQQAQGELPGLYERSSDTETTTGFAEGGIVDVYSGDMSKLQTTGDGIESFLNPERSKATLRRNLAKLAPRPTAPVMQQGIMPMAR
jgi:hypothetical protein